MQVHSVTTSLTEIIQPNVMSKDMIPVMKKILKPAWHQVSMVPNGPEWAFETEKVPVYRKNIELAAPDCASLENRMRAIPIKPSGIFK